MDPSRPPVGAPTLANRHRDAGLMPRPRNFGAPVDAEIPVRQATGTRSEPTVSVILPTYNEAGNIPVLFERLAAALQDRTYEIIVVDDDSSDGTWQVAEQQAKQDERIEVIRRTEDRGLSSAVLAGMSAATGRVLVVMDADLQHDERKIPDLVAAIEGGEADVCLGSREADGGSYGSFQRRRRLISWAGAALARKLLRVPVTDPMSGFFAISRDRFELVGDEVNPRGFKIMLEFLARGPRPRVAEVGYRFGERVSGSTKLTGSVAMEYLRALAELFAHRVARRTGLAD